jgi:hypothetical protein
VEAYEVIAALTSMERETTPEGYVNTINNFRTNETLVEKRKMFKVIKSSLDQIF